MSNEVTGDVKEAMTSFAHNPDQPEKRKGKAYVKLVNSDVVMAEMQIVSEGGENNMHSHPATDGFWWVVRGRRVLRRERRADGRRRRRRSVVPRGVPYWFEKGGDEPLHLLHVAAKSKD